MAILARPYQVDALNALWDYFYSGNKGHPVIAHPTGLGKSILPALFIQEAMRQFPDQKFLMVTHVKELIKQNYDVVLEVWPNAPIGIYSAGLKQRDFALPIIYGGIQSMHRNAHKFGHRDIIFIDEGHMISTEEASMYQSFLSIMKLINPKVRFVGMTATPFRMGQGYITDGGLFTDIVHDLTSMEAFNKLVHDGYLAPLIPLRTRTKLDISNVSIVNGDYSPSQLQKAIDINEVTFEGLKELVAAGQNRRSWLIFASGIEHSEHIAEMLGQFGIQCAAVHSKQKADYNDSAIEAFKDGRLRAIANFGKLTTGFNNPYIDLIGMFRPTLSIPLHIQMLGRGTRPTNGKQNCLVLDYGRNTARLGPINDPIIPKKKGEGTGDVPIKICEQCGAYNHTRVRICCQCGSEFHFSVKIVDTASDDEVIRTEEPIFKEYEVVTAIYRKMQRIGANANRPPYIKAIYNTVGLSFSENVFPEDQKYAKHLFNNWWKLRHPSPPPQTVDQVLQIVSELKCPKRIRVHVNKAYPEIVAVMF